MPPPAPDPDVVKTARFFGVDPALIQGVIAAEGGRDALVRAVKCSLPGIQTFEQALAVTCRSAARALSDFVKTDASKRRDFLRFWGARWAPEGAANDPTHLNQHWPKNVGQRSGWEGA